MHNPYGQICRHIKACGDNAPKLQQILDDNHVLLLNAKGSQHNHQAWDGGWLQHVADTIQIAQAIHNKFDMTAWPIPFSWSSVVLVLFLHDIEKPFMQARMAEDPQMPVWTKVQRLVFRYDFIAHYKLHLTHEEQKALVYIEGEGDYYSPTERVMNELSALCHAADILSARLWHSRNKPTTT